MLYKYTFCSFLSLASLNRKTNAFESHPCSFWLLNHFILQIQQMNLHEIPTHVPFILCLHHSVMLRQLPGEGYLGDFGNYE